VRYGLQIMYMHLLI